MPDDGRNRAEIPSDPTKDIEQKETAYGLLWPTVTTKPSNRLRDPLLIEIFHIGPVILGLNVGDLLLYLLSCHYIKCLGCFWNTS